MVAAAAGRLGSPASPTGRRPPCPIPPPLCPSSPQGFIASSWLRPWRAPKVALLRGGALAGPAEQLLQQVPDSHGLYLLLAKPPGGRRHLPCYLGKAGPLVGEGATPTLRARWAPRARPSPLRLRLLSCCRHARPHSRRRWRGKQASR
jgi:hypothetical protein